jgi:acyl carrier protein
MQALHDHAIQSWLITQLAEQLGLSSEDIDVHKPFTEYGLDSIIGVSLAGDLEDWLGLQLSPTVLWDYPTPEALARYLVAELQCRSMTAQHTTLALPQDLESLTLDAEEAEQLLAALDTLSDAEVDTLLNQLLLAQGLAA